MSPRNGRVPLSERYVDLFYFLFFALHLFASACVDSTYDALTVVQGLVPASVVPPVLRTVLHGRLPNSPDYLAQSADPFIPNAWLPRYAWLRMSLLSEFVVQVPAFVLGMWAMWKDDCRAYPLLAIYGMLGCFTTLQCIAMVTLGVERRVLTSDQVMFLLQYVAPLTSEITSLLCSSPRLSWWTWLCARCACFLKPRMLNRVSTLTQSVSGSHILAVGVDLVANDLALANLV